MYVYARLVLPTLWGLNPVYTLTLWGLGLPWGVSHWILGWQLGLRLDVRQVVVMVAFRVSLQEVDVSQRKVLMKRKKTNVCMCVCL